MGKTHKTLVKASYFLERKLVKYISNPIVYIEEDGINEKSLKIHLDNPSTSLIHNINECANETYLRFGIKTVIRKYITN